MTTGTGGGMRLHEMLPVERSAQRSLTAAWQRVMSDGAQALEQLDTVRAPVKAS
ncbi:hypothetical protein [Gemmatimonas sp.]|uniref:hypothetical protein n=1 Tax=Gemmatimonas sp. TaxID=1962908 RepID=UPI00286EA4CE|nr:hypothetical protein [Gemmatimonas sp.]